MSTIPLKSNVYYLLAGRPSLAARLQSRQKGTNKVPDVKAPMLPVSGRRQGERSQNLRNRQGGQQGQVQGQGRIETRVQMGQRNERRDGNSSPRPAGRSVPRTEGSNRSPVNASWQRSPQLNGPSESRETKIPSVAPNSEAQSRPRPSSPSSPKKPMLQKSQTPAPTRVQRPPQQAMGRNGGRPPLSRRQPGQSGKSNRPQTRAGAQGRIKDRRPKKFTKKTLNGKEAPTDPELNDYTGEPPVRKYDESGLLVLKGEHAQLNQPIPPRVSSIIATKMRPFGLPSPILVKMAEQAGISVSSYAERAVPETVNKLSEGGLTIVDNAKLALSRVRDLRVTEREKALQLVEGFVGKEQAHSTKGKTTTKSTS